MRLHTALAVVSFLAASTSAHGSSFAIDNFSCADSISLTGSAVAGPGEATNGFNASFVPCPGSLGGVREDFFVIPTGPADSVSTIESSGNGAITGTFGSGISENEGINWGGPVLGDLNLDLVGDSILVQIQSDSGGTINIAVTSTTIPDTFDDLTFSATFLGSPGYQDVLIPLTGTPTVLGTGADLNDVTDIDMYLSLNTAGGTWSIDGIEAVPEPPTLLLTGICFLGVLTRSFWRRFSGG